MKAAAGGEPRSSSTRCNALTRVGKQARHLADAPDVLGAVLGAAGGGAPGRRQRAWRVGHSGAASRIVPTRRKQHEHQQQRLTAPRARRT